MSKVITGKNDLKSQFPDIAREFHPIKNGELTPEIVACKSHRMIWWKCEKGHEWEAMVSNRTGLGRRCPYCTGQRPIIGETDLASVNPELAKEWHPIKNAPLKPTDITFGSNKKIWWKCKQGHEWQSTVKSRNSLNTGCPYCSDYTQIVVKGENDFESRYPQLAKEWHPTRNLPLTADSVSYASGKKVWWQCKFGHEYQIAVYNKAKGKSCTVCSRRRRTSFPEQAFYYYLKQVYPDAVNSYRDIFKGGMELDIYIPSLKLGIEYDGKIFHRKKENLVRDAKKYQICKENGIQLIRIIDINNTTPLKTYDRVITLIDPSDKVLENGICELLYHLGKLHKVNVNLKQDRLKILEYLEKMDKSLAIEFPEIAAEFHPTKNGKLTAEYFHPGSNERVWWKCSKCGFEWKAGISDRTGPDKNGCRKCSKIIGGKKKHKTALRENGSLASKFPELLKYWNYEKNTISPTEVTPKSSTKVWWVCDKGHAWDSDVGHITSRGANCPYCNNKRILKGFNDLATINPNLAMEWDFDKNGDMTPYNIGAGSGKKAWWICSKCKYNWQSVITGRNSGTGCPNCDLMRKRGNKYAVKKQL